METIPRNDFDTRNRYDAFCKAVLRNEAKTTCRRWRGTATVKSRWKP